MMMDYFCILIVMYLQECTHIIKWCYTNAKFLILILCYSYVKVYFISYVCYVSYVSWGKLGEEFMGPLYICHFLQI